MANTTVVTGKSVDVSGLDADWVHGTDLAAQTQLLGRHLQRVEVVPSAIGDVVVVRNGGIAGAFSAKFVFTDIAPQVMYYPADSQVAPAIKISECTLGTAANARVLFQYY